MIATTAVGAVAGGLVRHGATASSCRPATPAALAAAIRRLHDDPELRERLGAQAREDVAAVHAGRLGGRHVPRAGARPARPGSLPTVMRCMRRRF